MRTHVKHVTQAPPEPYGLDALRRDCAGMLPHWRVPVTGEEEAAGSAPGPRGVSVPEGAARLLDAMSEYGD
ncbi:hypothetical protein I5Q34_04545 [Streptomyces sp. AV19]|uniref:hypothetical protein n=1 Tax=Streptomyces sp. AV19 TaxID=2793068 RepID=UPI0018FEFFAC|nr:hypothetical protein [Streptomyces sp. AV19]MBH1933566.1 hypothetical protein [Streptomyces sp. AV19]MDG4532221.1 hypothetical protein [Streptomyces sp. AV19]